MTESLMMLHFKKYIFPMKDSIASSSQAPDIFALKFHTNSEPTTHIEQVTEKDIDAPQRRKI
jgi:hypothetical protein